jgi:plastocyanin
MSNIITPNTDKIVFIKMIMIVVVTSVGVLQHNINNTTAQEQPAATATFETPGIYNYVCILHPWMTGSVVVN